MKNCTYKCFSSLLFYFNSKRWSEVLEFEEGNMRIERKRERKRKREERKREKERERERSLRKIR